MSVPAGGPPQHPYRCFTLNPDYSQNRYVGGSYDNISAVTIASALYTAREQVMQSDHFLIGVFDDTDTPIAFIGLPPS